MNLDISKIANKAGIEVLETIDLLEYDSKMDMLYERLKKYFNYTFKPNQRLVFIYTDTDFIVSNLRFTLYNLQLILFRLYLPNFVSIIIGQQDITVDLKNLQATLTNEPCAIDSIFFEGHCLYYMPPAYKLNLNENSIEKNFIFLSSTLRSHRIHFYKWLRFNNLLDKGLVSFKAVNASNNETVNFNSTEIEVGDLKFLYTCPFTRINENWISSDQETIDIFNLVSIENFKNFTEENYIKTDTNDSLTQKAFCYISNETVFNYPTYTTEKSFKAFSAMRPMISFGSAGILSRLKNQGFKTWDKYWSEEYDSITDSTQRFKAVTKLIEKISMLSIDDCKSMLLDMQDILEHNRNLYIDKFIDMQANFLYSGFAKNKLKY